jgi:glucokinase
MTCTGASRCDLPLAASHEVAPVFLGIEIGGTKLQLGVGADDGTLAALWRGTVDVAAGPDGIRRQITTAVPELLQRAGLDRGRLKGVGIGFGGPVDDATQTIIKSHQIDGWDDFPLADWITDVAGLPSALGNDADVAGLAEALHGAGKGLSPIFYITVGSGIGGGFIINGEIYRGVGRGAAEIGHLRTSNVRHHFTGSWSEVVLPLEERASGWAIERAGHSKLPSGYSAKDIVTLARQGDEEALANLDRSWEVLADGISHVITLLCPRRIVIGGGISLIGEALFFEPLRRFVAERVFKPFAGLTDIVPSALGEEVVVHGAIALARKRFGA